MALGAQRADMMRLILKQSLILVGTGMVTGVILALGGTRVLASFLFGIGATDVGTYLGVMLLLAFAAFAASYLPARRAMRVDPMIALRHE
jgi:putative ABC transport system permease protein